MLSAYCAAKHGVVGLTRALAEELRGDAIAVNGVARPHLPERRSSAFGTTCRVVARMKASV